MDRDRTRLTPHDASHDPELADWRVLLGRLHARFDTGDFATGARLVAAITEAAEELDHHPDVDLRYPHVTVSTVSHDVGHLTGRDRELARRISEAAQELDVEAVPVEVSTLEVGLDVMDADAVRPFWVAVLGLEPDDRGDLVDPDGRLAGLWFQQMDEPRTQRNRVHLDISVPHDVAEQRVADALAAGGTLVSDERAPSWWVLADAERNEVCVCTWQARSSSGEPGVS